MARRIDLFVDPMLCKVCSRCQAAAVCKLRAITRIDPDEPPFLDVTRCRDCRLCLPACPYGAIQMPAPPSDRA